MIRRIGSSDPRFRPIIFRPGLNVVLALRSEGSTDKASTNATGKTAIVEIIHFLLGGDLDRLKTLCKAALNEHAFFMEFTVGPREIGVRRSPAAPKVVWVSGLTDSERKIAQPKAEHESAFLIEAETWKRLLGHWMFDLPLNDDERGLPSFRGLFAYFARHPESAFINFKSTVPYEGAAAAERKYSYLLLLDWRLTRDATDLKSEYDKSVADQTGFKQLAKRLGANGPSDSQLAADLAFMKAAAENEADQAKRTLDQFRVLPEYEAEERRADELASKMQGLRREILTGTRLLDEYRASARETSDMSGQEVADLYDSAGVELAPLIKRRIDEVTQFHRTLVIERQAFLSAEISRVQTDLDRKRSELEDLDEQKSRILNHLEGAKALPEYTELSLRASELRAKAMQLAEARGMYDDLLKTKAALSRKKADLQGRFTSYALENQEFFDSVVAKYGEMSQDLHESMAQLILRIDFPRQSFPKFFVDVKIEGKGATGRTRAEVFLFDLLLAQLWSKSHGNIEVLVHDTHMFDSMDPRQRAHSILLAAETVERHDFQHIMLFNESEFPKVDLDQLLGVEGAWAGWVAHATDDTPDGGTFGFRFDDFRHIDAVPDSPEAAPDSTVLPAEDELFPVAGDSDSGSSDQTAE